MSKKIARSFIDRVKRENARRDKKTVDSIERTAQEIYKKIMRKGKPMLRFPVRSLSNVSYDKKKGYLEIGRARKERTLTVNTVKGFAQTLRMMGLSRELVQTNDFATKRDVYYQSKNWAEAKFTDQSESDTVMDDIDLSRMNTAVQLPVNLWCSIPISIAARLKGSTAHALEVVPIRFPHRSNT